MPILNLKHAFLISSVLRILLIVYGEWQDANMEVRYTDIDYFVFSDAASLVVKNKSPFERSTYRYSPLLAFLMLPNSYIHRSFGKFIFSAAGKILQAAFWYGLIVHFRVYPIIYVIPLVLTINKSNRTTVQRWNSKQKKSFKKVPFGLLLKNCFTKEKILFGLLSGSIFLMWTALFFYLYGWDFLNEALLYHLTRIDPRHNFSIYFYHIYLRHQHGFSTLEKLSSFLPQMMVQLALIFSFFEDIPFCLFVQTVAFVAFNKVITAQFFVWYFSLLPLILPWSNMKLKWKGFVCILVWMASQLHWLAWAYLLEFKGKNVFVQLWLASLIFLFANTWVLFMIIKHHRYMPVFLTSAIFDGEARKSK